MNNIYLLVDDVIDINNTEHDSFTYFRLYNKTFRTTKVNRLDDVNVLANNYIPETRPLQVLDLAISSGITSVEWKNILDKDGIENNYLATDATLYGTRVKLGPLTLLFEEVNNKKQYLLQVDLFGYACPNASGSRWRNVICRVFSNLTKTCVFKGTQVYIIDPAAIKINESDNSFSLKQINLFEINHKLTTSFFNVVRAAKILNKAYFDDVHIKHALNNIKDVMANNSLFIVVRTHLDGSNHGAYYHLKNKKYQCVGVIGEGSEIHELIVSI